MYGNEMLCLLLFIMCLGYWFRRQFEDGGNSK